MASRASVGFISSNAVSSAFVTSKVLAPYWLDIVSSTPGLAWIRVSPNFGAKHAAFGDSRHGQKPRLERPIGKRAQFHRRKLFRGQTDFEQVHRRGGQRRHFRSLHPDRQQAGRFSKSFGEHLAGEEDVG